VAWTWRYEKADGTTVSVKTLPNEVFPSQSEAESWLGERWRALLGAGVDQVTLLEDNEVTYGPMSLHPPDPSDPNS
jgi:hypothetical protein